MHFLATPASAIPVSASRTRLYGAALCLALVGAFTPPPQTLATSSAADAPGTARGLERALEQLKSSDPATILQGMQALGRLGDLRGYRPLCAVLDATSRDDLQRTGLATLEKLHYTPGFLLDVLKDPAGKPLEKSYAAYTLGMMQSVEAVPFLIEALKSPHESVRSRSIDALGKIQDPRAWKPLILAANKDPSPELRKKAQKTVESVTSLGGSRGLDAESLTLQLKDPSALKRREAAQALSSKGNWWSVRPLIDALSDPDAEVRRFSARALGDLQDRRAVEPLLAFVPRARGLERYTALAALGVLKDDTAVEPLIGFLKDPDADTRRLAARALGTLGSPRAGAALTEALSDLVPQNRREAARSVGTLRYSGAIPKLSAMAKDDTEENQIEAARTLGRIGGMEALNPLLRILQHDNPMVVVAAIIATKEIGRAEALPSLEQLARRHKEPLVQEEALEALTELKGKLNLPAGGKESGKVDEK